MIHITIIVLLLNITILQTFKKWGWLDWYSARFGHIRWLPKAGCYLCLSFWLSFVTGPLYYVAYGYDLEWLFIPLAVAGVSNILLTNHEKV